MKIGIDASHAFVKNKTGIEEYSYQVIKHLRKPLENNEVVLYLDTRINGRNNIDFDLPENWKIKFLRTPFFFWTQARLSLEMLFRPVSILFIPAHTVPIIHPQNNIVVVHGLEFEFCPKAYSFFDRLYMRWVIRSSCYWAKKVIAVSENTKKDLIKLYKVPDEKIKVIYNGIDNKISNFPASPAGGQFPISNKISNSKSQIQDKFQILNSKYFLFVGRLEERKNICGIIEAFEILKEKYNISHKLVLTGIFGHGANNIKVKIGRSRYKDDIILSGYVEEEEKFWIMKNASVFLFPSFYEGFGLPILEAQSAGVPVVTSNISSMPEIAGSSAVLVDPRDANVIAEAVYKIISDKGFKDDIIKKGLENVKRFSWESCAKKIAEMIYKL